MELLKAIWNFQFLQIIKVILIKYFLEKTKKAVIRNKKIESRAFYFFIVLVLGDFWQGGLFLCGVWGKAIPLVALKRYCLKPIG